MAHFVQLFRVFLTVAHFRQFRVPSMFVNVRTVEIRKPCFDIPSRHDDYDWVLGSSPWNAFFPALILKLRATLIRSEIVCIDNNEKHGSLFGSHRLQLMRILFPHPLLAGLRPVRERSRDDIPVSPIPFLKKSPDERICLTVLAKQDDADSLHSCQSLATISDNASPSTNFGGLSLTRTGPIPSRENQRPLAPPR